MLSTLSQDLLALGQHVSLMRDARLPDLPPHPLLKVEKISNIEAYQQSWQHSLQENKNIVLIAPETDGVLYQLVRQLEQSPIRHLGSSPDAIQLCTDKYQTFEQLSLQRIPTPATQTVRDWLTSNHNNDLWLIKPRDGAGCEQTYKFNSIELEQYLRSLSNQQQSQQIIQPYIVGDALSLSLFLSETEARVLSVNRQHLKEVANQLSLSHCQPGCESLISRDMTEKLIQQVRATIPGLWGFVGIDLVLSDNQIWVIEINPRLTSSYAEPGFRQHHNPALALYKSIQK